MQSLKPNKYGSAKSQINIKSVVNEVLILPEGRYRSVIETSSVNFELKSETEQDALIETYQSFLNSLGSPIQILVRTREVDLDVYLNSIKSLTEQEKSDVYRKQILGYGEFIRSLVNVNRILSRSFYIIVPLDDPGKNNFDYVRDQLSLKNEIVTKGLQRMGMHARMLGGIELLNLFYSFYNPIQSKTQPLGEAALKIMHTALIGEKIK